MEIGSTHYASLLAQRAARAGIATDGGPIEPPAERWAVLRGLRFRYLDWGGEGRPAILFLHGGGLNAHAWDLVCLALRDRFRCIALDQRGHGDTDWSDGEGYRLESMAEDVRRLVAQLQLAPVLLVGHSMGGLVAIALAGGDPDCVARLAIVDVSPDPRAEGAAEVFDLVSAGEDFESLDAAVHALRRVAPLRSAESLRQTLALSMRQGADSRWRWKYDPSRFELLRTAAYIADRRRLWDRLPEIACPTLIVHGGRSRILLHEDAERMAGMIPQASIVTIEQAGHNVHTQAPARLAALLAEHFGG